jgi:thioredoxin 1
MQEVDDRSFEQEVLLSDTPVLVDFWAAWCPPCHQIAPVLEQIANERAGRLRIVKMDYDANPVTPSNYRVMGLPTLILFAGGRPVASMVGARPKSALLRDIDATLESIPAA